MKIRKLIAVTIGLLFAFSSCERCEVDCNLTPAKIIRYDCDRVIFQLLSTDTIGDADWVDVQTGKRFSNVVSYNNTCKIAELTKGKMMTLYISIAKGGIKADIGDCSRCEALSQSPPQTMVDFTIIDKQPCEVAPVRE